MDPYKQLNLLAIIVAALGCSYLLGNQIASIRTADRTVQVKGAAELPVQADLAIWSLNFSNAAEALPEAQTGLNTTLEKTRAYLTKFGFKPEELENTTLSVTDTATNPYGERRSPRFTVNGGLTVRSGNLTAVQNAKNALGNLVASGVVLTNSYGPNYSFTKLNEAKPELISKATAVARLAAEQFAKDSGQHVGGIRRARQGSVEIMGRDSFTSEAEQPAKILRVVTTVDYDLR
jgi:hypothetical protein